MKKTLAIIFYAGNANADKNIINVIDYLNKSNLVQNENSIKYKNSNIKLVNLNAGKFLKNQLAEAYKKYKLV